MCYIINLLNAHKLLYYKNIQFKTQLCENYLNYMKFTNLCVYATVNCTALYLL